MKSTRKYLLAVCALAIGFALPSIHAQSDNTPPAQKERAPRDRQAGMKERLGLSDTQAAQIQKIHEEEREQLKALREKEGKREEKVAEMRKIRASTKAKVDTILTAEQRAKRNEQMEKREGGPRGDKADKAPRGDKGPKDGKGANGPASDPAEEPAM